MYLGFFILKNQNIMKKKLLFLTILLISVIGYSQTFTVQNSNFSFMFEITSPSTVSLKFYTPSDSNPYNVVIPASVSNGGTTYTVTSIDNFVFLSKAISSLSIPDSVISIGQFAFSSIGLTSVVLPSSLETIGDFAFQNNQFSVLTIPSNVTSIGNGAFIGNPLTSVTSLPSIPPSITTTSTSINDSFHSSGNRSGIDLIIPVGTTGAYVTDPGALWTGFNTVTESTSLSSLNFEKNNQIKLINRNNGLEVTSANSATLKNYTIYNMTGAKISQGSETSISIGTLSKGIYIVELQFNEGRLAKKFIK
ncbi:leucine-rich repeat protein [Seonamhaeicola marinus]|uniref:Leucine-rich repeat protein n=2 Tax=Seonamhaeicola marinus TaxID=1912246 RepID=A0A5D0IRY3_9FLAO|nr:leucine-rich repeat protein [Seonamhaeicola marinus]